MSCADETGCFSITWEIENFDIFLRAEYGDVTSTPWKTETTDGNAVRWCLSADHGLLGDVRFRLVCLDETWYPDKWESYVISSCGEILHTNLTVFESVGFLIKKDIFDNKMHSKNLKNTLKLDCKMWRNSIKNGGFCMHSVVKKVDFCWCILFSPHSRPYARDYIIEKDNMRINVILESKSKNQYGFWALALPVTGGCFSFVSCKIVGDVTMKETAQLLEVTKYNDLRTQYVKKWVIVEKSDVIPNAELNFQLDFTVAHHNNCQYQMTQTTGSISEAVNSPLSEDLLHLYRESILSDATLNTEGKSFSAHRSILAARSPVFRAMFEKEDMNEGRSGVVDIDDLDSETVDRMLVFLYGGSVVDLQWKDASVLYYAADKYAVLPLKQKCADILKAGLSSDNVCDLLVFFSISSRTTKYLCVGGGDRKNAKVLTWANL